MLAILRILQFDGDLGFCFFPEDRDVDLPFCHCRQIQIIIEIPDIPLELHPLVGSIGFAQKNPEFMLEAELIVNFDFIFAKPFDELLKPVYLQSCICRSRDTDFCPFHGVWVGSASDKGS